ncbi:MAG: hypothetical protein EOM37_12830 [Proteobacteria bacterium]|nr:hypothetical protein [Pseudomonadota bacterium]
MKSITTEQKNKIQRFFKVYCKNIKTNETDSIFNIIGNTEPDLTKSLAFCLSYSQEFLEELLNKLQIKDAKDVVISAEQPSKKGEYRRDISLNINNINGSKELVIIEAKSPCKNGSITKVIEMQLSNYFNSHYYTDIYESTKLTGVSLQKEHIYIHNDGKFEYKSLTWLDVITILKKINDNNIIDNNCSLLIDFYNHLIRASNLKTYEAEIFSPPCGNSYSLIEKYKIYCCPADRSLKECLYLMPRLPVNGNHDLIRNKYPDIKLTENKGKGIAMEMYQITNSFIVSTSHIDELIENEEIKKKVAGWIENINKDEELKVYILGEKLKFERPKFTKGQNNAYQGYYKLHEIWSDTIKGA